MRKNIEITFIDAINSFPVESPSKCPHCGKTMSPELIGQSQSSESIDDDEIHFSIFFRCSFEDCQKYFAIEYISLDSETAYPVDYNYQPSIKVHLPDNIEKISEDFVQIYSQAAKAEKYGLYDVCGLGYRKSAEFLIKDYAIKINPEASDTIKVQPLGQTIKTYLSDFPKIQALSTATAWLGNDEAHYIRKHTDKDLSDLKRFIIATATFIAADFSADTALDFISK